MEAIDKLGIPKNKHELQKLLGLVNYVRDYMPNLSEISNPLRELLSKDVIFQWLDTHSKCLEQMKKCIMNAPPLRAFDCKENISIQADASQHGLGCYLMQKGRPVCFASRSLSSAEVQYAQIEKEFLAVVFACKKFYSYIHGRQCEIITDHKPLLGIMRKDYHKIASARLQRMKLRLQKYRLSFKYLPGKFLYIADLLSRSFGNEKSNGEIKELNEMIHSINISDDKKEIHI